jgi:sulfite reductase alpha subunit-like flavoprotein
MVFDVGASEWAHEAGDIICILPKNSENKALEIMSKYGLKPNDLLKITKNPECSSYVSKDSILNFPPIITAKELFEFWLNISEPPSRYFIEVLAHF